MERVDSYEKMRTKLIRFTTLIVNLMSTIPNSTAKFIFEKQIIRCASSIGANYVEGNGGVTRKDWKNYMNISKKSAFETLYWLDVIQDANLKYDKSLYEKSREECLSLIKIFVKITKAK